MTDKLQEQYIKMCQHMRDNGIYISKCNGFNWINGEKAYCDKYCISGDKYNHTTGKYEDNIITNGDVYICEGCNNAKKCFCDDHAPDKLVEIYSDGKWCGIFCIDCIADNIYDDESKTENEIRSWTRPLDF